METYQVIAGFSDIKVELKERGRITKSFSELRLWFTFRDDILCVHDYADHSKFIIIGLYDSKLNSWSILLRANSYGERLVLKMTSGKPSDDLVSAFQTAYLLLGHIPFSR